MKSTLTPVYNMNSSFYRGALSSLAALLLSTTVQAAPMTYTYTAPITSWNDATGHNWALYAGLNAPIKFEFTTAAPLVSVGCVGVNCAPVDVLPQVLSWNYNGGNAFMNLGSDIGGTLTGLNLSTDANGQVISGQDQFYVNGPTVIAGLEAYTSSFTMAHSQYDQGVLYSTYSRFVTYGYMYAPVYGGLAEGMSNMSGSGQWTVTSVPEPETYAMLLAGLGLVGFAVRRRAASAY
jgi:hypothetical protein